MSLSCVWCQFWLAKTQSRWLQWCWQVGVVSNFPWTHLGTTHASKRSHAAQVTTETAARWCECSTKTPSPQTHSFAEYLCTFCGYATLNSGILSKYELLQPSARRQKLSARLQIKTTLFFGSNLCRFPSKFAWALPLSLSSLQTAFSFCQNRQ